MPLTNTTMEVLRSTPYFDDYSAEKGFTRILYKKGMPVQTRELNQTQAVLQNQIEAFASGVYKEGAAVRGGNQTFSNNASALQVVRDDNVDIDNFFDAATGRGVIVRGVTSGAEAAISQVTRQTDIGSSYSAIIIAPMTAETFVGSESVQFIDPTTNSLVASMVTAPSVEVLKNAATFSIDSGIFYLRGQFVSVPTQTIILSTTTGLGSYRIGFTIQESIVSAFEDGSLYDPAFGASSYAGPGADRLKIIGTLTAKPIVEFSAHDDFIEIARIVDGVLVAPSDKLIPTLIEETLARRTYDESGDYVVRPFRLTVKDHNPPVGIPNITGRITGNTTSRTITASDYTTTITNSDGTTSTVRTRFLSEVAVGDVIVVGGEKRTVESVISDTALVVAEQPFSTDFSNTTATVISDQLVNLELEAGKAYVRGFEFETSGTTKLVAPRARTTKTIDNGRISTSYGPYLLVTRPGTSGLFDINAHQQVDLHSVPTANVNASSINSTAGTYTSTKIGTAYIRSFTYASGLGDANTVYKAYLAGTEYATKTFVANNSSTSSDSYLCGNVTVNAVALIVDSAANSYVLRMQQNSASAGGSLLSTTNNAYRYATVKLYDLTGVQRSYTVLSSNANSSGTRVTTSLILDGDDQLTSMNVTSNVVITFTERSVQSLLSGNSKSQSLDISIQSKTPQVESGATVAMGQTTSMLFKFRENWISANSISDESFDGIRLYTGVTSTVDGSNRVFALTAGDNETFYQSGDGETHMYFAAVNSSGQFVSLVNASVAIDGADADLTIPTSLVGSGAISVYTRVVVGTAAPRMKTLYVANTSLANVDVVSSQLVSNVSSGRGHIGINNLTMTSSSILSLGVADVHRIRAVYAVANPDSTPRSTTWIDVTDRYTLDNGQRDWCYDHAALQLKASASHPNTSHLLVMIDRFAPDATFTGNTGYFTAKSYLNSGLEDGYTDIPTFTNPKTGMTISLRDYIDFRPIRTTDLVAANTAHNPYLTTATFETRLMPHPQSVYVADYEHYLPRIDKVVLTKDKQLKLIQGTPSTKPTAPPDPTDGITLYVVNYPAYTSNVELVQLKAFEYRRYTMRDIGKLERRIENIEYYVQLSMLEQQTLNVREFDGDIERFKNGILVDSFASPAVSDTSHSDWRASIDERNKQLRPSFALASYQLELDVNNSSGVEQQGQLVTLRTTESQPFITQGLASKSVNINPFNVMAWFGSITMTPNSDTWFDTITRPTVTVNLFNENDGWVGERPYTTVWSDWTTIWSGDPTVINEDRSTFAGHVDGDDDPRQQWIDHITLTTTQSGQSTRTGVDIIQKASMITEDLGDRIVDLSVAPYMRSRPIAVAATGLRPGSDLIALFDEVDVTAYMERANDLYVANSAVASTFRVNDLIQSSSTVAPGRARIVGITDNILRVVEASGIFYQNALTTTISLLQGVYDVTDPSRNPNATVQRYLCYSGRVPVGGVTVSPSITIQLDPGASGSDSSLFVGKTIHLTAGGIVPPANSTITSSGVAGLKARITAYDTATNKVTLEAVPSEYLAALTAHATVPYPSLTPIYYSIGTLRADSTPENEAAYRQQFTDDTLVSASAIEPGAFYGLFRLPGSKQLIVDPEESGLANTLTSASEVDLYTQLVDDQMGSTSYIDGPLRFNVGTRVFRLADTPSSAGTFAEARFTSSGTTRTVERTLAQTRRVEFVTRPRNPETREVQEIRTSSLFSPTGVYLDPLAQTFIVPTDQYPNGLFLSDIDLFFAKKGISNVPVTVQIRPTVNGYPSADIVIAETRKYGQHINVVPENTTPSVSDATHYTRFVFDEPVYLAGGVEYAIVIISNSQEYEVFVGEIGQRVVANTAIIAEQPYGGSLFKSQNARTWTAEQNEDLMFVLHRSNHVTAQGTAAYRLRPVQPTMVVDPNSNVMSSVQTVPEYDYDILYIQNDYLDFPSTINYTTHTVETVSANTLARSIDSIAMGRNVEMTERKRIVANTPSSIIVRSTLRTTNAIMSPVYDLTRMSVTAVRNSIDNGPLYANGFVFTQAVPQGTPVVNNPYTLTITSAASGGMGANVQFTVNSTGYVNSVVVISGGEGYIETPTVSIASNSGDFATPPVFTYIGETSPRSAIVGEEKARYITRRVTLAEGFDASDIKVYISANRPPQTSIDVYYKVLSSGDTTAFNDRPWVLMELREDQQEVYASSNRQFRDYEYRTVNSTTGTTFSTFSIKIVMRSPNPVVIPRMKNLRVIALDE